MSEEEKWLVRDSDCDSDGEWRPKKVPEHGEEDGDESDVSANEKQIEDRKKSRSFGVDNKRRQKYEKELAELKLSESSSEEEEEDDVNEDGSSEGKSKRNRKARLLERREREGLAWMERGNGRRIVVSEQNKSGEEILDLRQHLSRMKKSKRGHAATDKEDEESSEDEESRGGKRKKNLRDSDESVEMSDASESDSDDKKCKTLSSPLRLLKRSQSHSRPRQHRMDKMKDRRWLEFRRSVSEKATRDHDKKKSPSASSLFGDIMSSHSYGLSSEKPKSSSIGPIPTSPRPGSSGLKMSFKKKIPPQAAAEKEEAVQGLVIKKGNKILSDSE